MFLQARYEILRSCLAELQRVGLIAAGTAPQSWMELQVNTSHGPPTSVPHVHACCCDK